MLNEQENENNSKTYYVNQKQKLLKGFDKFFKHSKKAIHQYRNDLDTDRIYRESRNEFINFIPEIPYIGGKKNRLTWNLTGSVMLLAGIRALEKEGISEREIGKIIYYTFESFFKSKPRFLMRLMGKLMFTKFMINKRIKQSEWVKSQNFSEGWVGEPIFGDGKTFDIGVDFTECGICKFYEKQDAKKYVPYLCLGDYPMCQGFGIGLTRTQTLGHGGEKCDFRLKKGGKTPDGWPPEKLAEWTSKAENPKN
jgi:hypothetical protein